jgi:hypothetical protein
VFANIRKILAAIKPAAQKIDVERCNLRNLQNVRRECGRHFRKKKEYLKSKID